MNKIIVTNDTIVETSNKALNIEIHEKQNIFDINRIKIEVIKDTSLTIEYKNLNKSKIDIEIYINNNIDFKLNEKKHGNDIKIQYKYFINENTNVIVNKIYELKKIKELNSIELNGENANINFNLNSICKGQQTIDIYVNHNKVNTNSIINNKAVTILEGTMTLNVTNQVENSIKNCKIEQINQIINTNNSKCIINPLLITEDKSIEAITESYIKDISEIEISKLTSEGMEHKKAKNLLIKKFMQIDIDNIDKILNKYWR